MAKSKRKLKPKLKSSKSTKRAPAKKATKEPRRKPTKKRKSSTKKKSSRDPNSALDAAVMKNDARGVARAFAAGADPNYKSDNRAGVASALEKGNPAIAEAFIAAGLDPNLDLAGTLDDGWSLLMLARNAKTARALIAAGADVHYQSPTEQRDTVLTMAAKIHPAEVVAVLLEHGADPNRPRGDGCTPLVEAGPRLDCVKLLLDAGAIDVPAYHGQSALDIAIDCRSDRLVALLKQYAKT